MILAVIFVADESMGQLQMFFEKDDTMSELIWECFLSPLLYQMQLTLLMRREKEKYYLFYYLFKIWYYYYNNNLY